MLIYWFVVCDLNIVPVDIKQVQNSAAGIRMQVRILLAPQKTT
jgi:hypothetical protein